MGFAEPPVQVGGAALFCFSLSVIVSEANSCLDYEMLRFAQHDN
jgi:hypothetical protein